MAKPIPVPLLSEEEFNLVINSRQTKLQKDFLKQSREVCKRNSEQSKK
jgi:hypothetical protein